ncbi:MAG: hypothetical protein LBH32_07020 [Dysgonamonadaceae bacterium]|jgi:hypothetical protein|nr:hypothetical protein [Dysgonamonadaceae bacterium]
MNRINKKNGIKRMIAIQRVSVFCIIAISCIYSTYLQAQNTTQSPYSRYGYGLLANGDLGAQRGMGGIGFGLRNSHIINPLNPASYSGVDSMTFMIDLGLTGQMAWYRDGFNNSKSRKINGNLDYVAIQIPLYRGLGMGIGFEPVSSVGFSYGDTTNLSNTGGYAQNTSVGSNGLNKGYATLSYKLFQNLSAGVNLSFLFGDVIHSNQATNIGYSVLNIDTLRSTGLTYEFGLQYSIPVAKNKKMVIGAIYSPKIKLNATYHNSEIRVDPNTGVIQSINPTSTKDLIFELPETYGLGFTYSNNPGGFRSFNIKNKFTVGADAQYQRWAAAKFFSKTDSLSNRLKINMGGEFVPDDQSRSFFKRNRYRVGAYYSNSYIKIGDKGYNEYGASLGVGIPMNDRRSFLNLAFSYSTVVPEKATFIHEKYFKITVSYTFNEAWFFKRKVQ